MFNPSELIAERTFVRRANAKQFSFVWEGEAVTGFYDAELHHCHLITDHDEETRAAIYDWLNRFLVQAFMEENEDEEESSS